ncbi:cyclic pyranopterin monophosphate synthase subunit MoaC [Malonomonas rubra DSM 5091]|uniref:Cyclic pyranopterin monophosphate synthase n=1 Tax=Malonomonas rubra DSM 5091 TaxID=1122189 RepID=A0A1M6GEY7_MALRU|nr:cyclic pyranopterin monophosphate synthase MoaC [Malonomonas rubra]SHJ08477.1 cyclic pyranopterin monophosphate synthase subunit MoaC [Malonomonas rubra DSM 5091]
MPDELTHFDADGKAIMVDVGDKAITKREALAAGEVKMNPATLKKILDNTMKKGDVLAVARLAGIMGAKQTSNLIPLCHPLPITSVEVDFECEPEKGIVHIGALTKVTGQTGIEMEALTAVSIAALTIYDMCKAIDKEMEIGQIRLLRKSGGRSGTFVRPELNN